jgi:hypothetical protein
LLLHDLTGDGLRDAIIGNGRGGLSFWRNAFVGISEKPGTTGDPFELYPDPASTSTRIVMHQHIGGPGRVDLLNALGAHMHSYSMPGNTLDISLDGIPSGIYLVRLSDGLRAWTKRLVVVR